ncbi:MAG TPA: hypothetical protein VK034_11910, partial [Enhygromyxa sp.]|nr:hypothetical protein [Enhygromyxa sp.]
SETGDEGTSMTCELVGGMDMLIRVPQPCGETNDMLDTYEHWFQVVEAGGSTWSVQFCDESCLECEPLAANLTLAPLPVADLAGPGACLQLSARRLGSGDDCDYHTLSIVEPGAAGRVVVLARRTELLELPPLDTGTGLMGFEPNLVEDETCDCAQTPDSCCGSKPATRYDYEVEGTVIPIGDSQTVFINQRGYQFWAFDAFRPGDCDAPTRTVWALTAAR